jgi:two-component system, OmpR family, phosphate regulon sensor histidine kinase PhoR
MQKPSVLPIASAKSVKLERERLNSLINSMGDGVIAIDEDLKIIITNGAALNILDINTTPAGKSIQNVLNILDKHNEKVDLYKIIQDTKTLYTTREWKMLYPDEEKINLFTSIAPVRLGYRERGKSDTKGYVILLRDITREKSLEEERDEFISVVSHELRTPITIAEGNISNAQLVFKKSGLQNQTVQSALEEAHSQIIFLAGMINDLSMLSRAERGKLTVDVETINAHDLIKELQKTYEPEVATKGLSLKVEVDPTLELLQSSRLYVREILQNFITNAIKYTDKGQITLSAQQKKEGIIFSVRDTGIGVSKSDQKKLFQKFFRSEAYHTRGTSGTGLGLYISLKLARLLHASISVDTQLGQGSTFSILVPNLK